jgi:hypothetical protein
MCSIRYFNSRIFGAMQSLAVVLRNVSAPKKLACFACQGGDHAFQSFGDEVWDDSILFSTEFHGLSLGTF